MLSSPPFRRPTDALTARRLVRAAPGLRLEAALIVLVLVGALARLTRSVSTVSRTSGLDYRSTRAQGPRRRAPTRSWRSSRPRWSTPPHEAELDALTLPTLAGFTFESMDVNRGRRDDASDPVRQLQGLYSLNQPVDCASGARRPRQPRESLLSVTRSRSRSSSSGVLRGDSRSTTAADGVRRLGAHEQNLYPVREHVLPEPAHDAGLGVLARKDTDTDERRLHQQRRRHAGQVSFDSRRPASPGGDAASARAARRSSTAPDVARTASRSCACRSARRAADRDDRPQKRDGWRGRENVKFAWNADWYVRARPRVDEHDVHAAGSIAGGLPCRGKAKPTTSECTRSSRGRRTRSARPRGHVVDVASTSTSARARVGDDEPGERRSCTSRSRGRRAPRTRATPGRAPQERDAPAEPDHDRDEPPALRARQSTKHVAAGRAARRRDHDPVAELQRREPLAGGPGAARTR